MFNKNDWLITHANCQDGAICSIVFQKFGGNKNNIIYSSPDQTKTDEFTEELLSNEEVDKIYLVDVSISKYYAEQTNKLTDRVTVIDHHKSAIPLAEYKWCLINKLNTQCGCLLFYHWCVEKFGWTGIHLDDLLELCEMADDRDRWVNKYWKSKDLHVLFSSLGQKKFIERCMDNISTNLTNEERYLVELEKEKELDFIHNFAKKMEVRYFYKLFDSLKIGFGVCEKKYVSDLGNYLCEEEGFEFVVLMDSNTVSLRTGKNNKYDMSAIAQKYGGGGHARAAGFTISNLLEKSTMNSVVDAFEFEP